MSGKSGKHDPMWGMLGFLASPEDRALAALVVEVEQEKNNDHTINYKSIVMRCIRDLALINGITNESDLLCARYKEHYEMIVDRIRTTRMERISRNKTKELNNGK